MCVSRAVRKTERVLDAGAGLRRGTFLAARPLSTFKTDLSAASFDQMTGDRISVDTQQRDKLYRLLVETVRDYAIFTLDPTGHVMSWNPGAQRFKGYTAEEAIGRHFSMFYPEDTKAARLPERELEIATRDGRVEDEGWRVRKDGTRFWANVVITALRVQGELVGFAKVTRDLTERKLAEERAREDAGRIAAAEAANRAKGEFLTTLSHELRTPLNAIAGYVDLLLAGVRGPLTPLQRQDLERIRNSERHLLGLINDLLYHGRIEAGSVLYEMRDVELGPLVDNVVALILPQAAGGEIAVRVEVRQPVIVHADATKLGQILLNLLANALRHSSAGSTIVVDWTVVGSHVALRVNDQGTGIPEDELEAIFEPFVQVGRNYTSSHEGAGLGLAISRDLARAMGGDITVRSRLGEGSTFTVLLPHVRSV